MSNIVNAWEEWETAQSGDWRDVSHSDSFYAGYEAAEKQDVVARQLIRETAEALRLEKAEKQADVLQRINTELNAKSVTCPRCGAVRKNEETKQCTDQLKISFISFGLKQVEVSKAP